MQFSAKQRSILLVLAIFGFLAPNGVFLYVAFTQGDTLRAAMANPIALTFIAEAFFLVGLFSWLIHRSGSRYPGWAAFVMMSIVGSLAFSVPMYLFLASAVREQP